MHSQQLQQRVASGSQACCSYAAAVNRSARSRRPASRQACRAAVHTSQTRSKHVCRAQGAAVADGDDSSSEQISLQLDPRNDSAYDGMTFSSNVAPDFEDPQWVEKITDWEEFWYSTEDEDLEFDEDLSAAERTQAGIERARILVDQIASLRKRADVQHMITGDVRPDAFYEDTYRSEEERVDDQQFYTPDPNPDYDPIDLRALAEKRKARGALNAEWKRQEKLLTRPYSFTLSQHLGKDARLQSAEFDWIREEWTHEQIMDLIVGRGKFAHPDQVKVQVLNPLLPGDFHNDVGVHVVPETEEFIEQIGHMATEQDIAYMESNADIRLVAKDFVDPSLVFDAPDGTQYIQAPANPWAEQRKAQDAEDLAVFYTLVDEVANRQKQREAAAAAAADGDAAAAGNADDGDYDFDEQQYISPDDELMGDGFSEYMARDERAEAAVLVYEDQLDQGLGDGGFLYPEEGSEQQRDPAEDVGEAEEVSDGAGEDS